MSRSEQQKMQAGDWYCCLDSELSALRHQARLAVHQHNQRPPDPGESLSPSLAALFADHGQNCLIEAPFHCAYGINITLGHQVYLNAGCTILDTAPVRIGDRSMLGPNVQIYCAQHHKDKALRAKGLEIAHPVTLGSDVWIGGGAIILPGVSIGDGAIVGAGAVVTRDVEAGVTVVGNPARALPR
ncbi:sugar O-acetyltransferase [Phaeobacter inhibens]|uniref:sugar O-acetyltransferase n=1 Tax=Phaeobacter inhibens TaxID=221822 RepID=UPI000160DADA|nr:sugar O-acetyltransferase [Phaeobacter inhibens]AFO87123.1 putative nodulation protein L [Phaeobacter inhibens 2.10]AXT41930.1 sugar O-acetyltransferase [Phaeobacter inhibens]